MQREEQVGHGLHNFPAGLNATASWYAYSDGRGEKISNKPGQPDHIGILPMPQVSNNITFINVN